MQSIPVGFSEASYNFVSPLEEFIIGMVRVVRMYAAARSTYNAHSRSYLGAYREVVDIDITNPDILTSELVKGLSRFGKFP